VRAAKPPSGAQYPIENYKIGTAMNEIKHTASSHDSNEMSSLLLGAGFALASLIILPALAQRIGLGSSLTIALRGALMRASNKI
jgi:hypothetical protein